MSVIQCCDIFHIIQCYAVSSLVFCLLGPEIDDASVLELDARGMNLNTKKILGVMICGCGWNCSVGINVAAAMKKDQKSAHFCNGLAS